MQRGIYGRVATTATAATKGANVSDDSFGIFQNTYVKPFPVRAAIDLGSGGVASLSVARVDAARGAVRDFMYHTQLPLHLQSAPSSGANGSFVLSDATRSDIRNKMRLLHGAMRRDAYEGLSERTAVLTWPLCEAADALQLAEQLTREFKVDVRVLGKTFHVEMPSVELDSGSGSGNAVEEQESVNSTQTAGAQAANNNNNNNMNNNNIIRNNNNNNNKDDSDGDSLRVLMRRMAQRRAARKHSPIQLSAHDSDPAHSNNNGTSAGVSPQSQMEQLAFLAHASVGQCVSAPRMLVLAEDYDRGISLLGTDDEPDATSPSDSSSGDASSQTSDPRRDCVVSARTSAAGSGIVRYALPVDTAAALRVLLSSVQRRSCSGDSSAVAMGSPNPVLREEFLRLRALLEEMIRPVLPQWAQEKARAGGMICASSYNGGALNIAARVAQRTSVSLEHLEAHAEMHYCGLTDVLLAANYPDPNAILPSAALVAALMRALDTRRVAYLPDVSPAAALLLQPGLWTFHKRARVQKALRASAFYAGGSAARSFERPRMRENPTALPDAAWQRNQSWNPLSPANSMRGT